MPVAKLYWLSEKLGKLSPGWVAFFGSLLLSLIDSQQGTINRDGMLYVETARVLMEGGFNAARNTFQLPLFPTLMAVTAQVTGLGLEGSGQLLNGLFMAGACALLVTCASRMFPEAAWHICLVLLAIPGFNGYRDELLREYGCWFFVMLSFWLALRWSDAPRWPLALAIQSSLLAAALFRPEAVAFFLALALWQFFEAPVAERWRRLVMIGGLPMMGLAVLVALYLTGNLGPGRLAREFARFSLEHFNTKALAIAPAFIEYARDQVRTILFFGSLSIIPVKFIAKMGIFILPLLYAFSNQSVRALLGRNRLFAWAFFAHLLVLCVFVLDLQFLAGRYVGLLLAFAAPLTGYGFWLLMKRFPGWKIPMVLLAMLVMAGNVLSPHPAKQHFVEAGGWLAKHASDTPRVYVGSTLAAHYAGWHLRPQPSAANRAELVAGLAQGKYDLVVLEVSHRKPDTNPRLDELRLSTIARFAHPNGDAVIIAKPVGADHDKPSNTSIMREKTGSIE
ncbi:MAG: hypothetical protein FIA96_12930 [Betaproteobacteria bacterium]|nr:hypothetical protein [Betaproteobacteria bacterium]